MFLTTYNIQFANNKKQWAVWSVAILELKK